MRRKGRKDLSDELEENNDDDPSRYSNSHAGLGESWGNVQKFEPAIDTQRVTFYIGSETEIPAITENVAFYLRRLKCVDDFKKLELTTKKVNQQVQCNNEPMPQRKRTSQLCANDDLKVTASGSFYFPSYIIQVIYIHVSST
ncbi:hypothetical protein ACJMK2_013097 [Sinanodonta woodiana]|uniref:Uncharacterized protein n=1 Tax=Sinanodonta woodiana TaxID=1069815 RepID=A0ABD3VAA6_SINWO